MKMIFAFLALCLLMSASMPQHSKKIVNTKYDTGEQLEYRIHYGFINAGEVKVSVDPKLYTLTGKTCYHMKVEGRTTGAFDYAVKIRDVWGTFVDTSSLKPLKAYRNIKEGNYRKEESTYLDYKESRARIINERKNEEKTIPIPQSLQDIVSGYYYMRLVDYDNMSPVK